MSNKSHWLFAGLFASVLAGFTSLAASDPQSQPPATAKPAAQPAPCTGPEFRQFDFWLGNWNVHTPDGKLAGTNRIESQYGGCVVHERYLTGGAYSGESLNIYDATRKVWHQSWVDSSGTLLMLEGKRVGPSMILEGKIQGSDGKMTRQRITWTANSDGSVRQHWESADASGKWTTAFDGRYTKKE